VGTATINKVVTVDVKVLPRIGTGAAAFAVAMVAVACTGEADDGTTSTPSSVVIQPGRPGEDSTTIAPEDFVDDDSGVLRWNDVDVDFMTMMIDHHLQALEVAELAPGRAENEQVKAIADRIHDTQAAEIHGIAAWLQERELPVPVDTEDLDGEGPRAPETHTDHSEQEMPGMLTDDQLAALGAARGAEFDRLFLEDMIQHHEGAVEMSVTVLEEGLDERANEMATDMGAGQQAEIGRLQDILASM